MVCRALFVVVALVVSLLAAGLSNPMPAHAESVHIPLPPPSGFPNPGIEVSWPELGPGVALSQEAFPGADAAIDSLGSGQLGFVDCRWLWHGRMAFDFEVSTDPDLRFPATIRLGLFRGVDGVAYDGWIYDLTLSGPGTFTALLDMNEVNAFWRNTTPTGGREWTGSDWQVNAESLPECIASSYDANGNDVLQLGSVAQRVQIAAPVSPFGRRSVETLLTTIDPTDPDETLRPLASLLSQSDLPRFDRIYAARNQAMTNASVAIEGTCIAIHSVYENGVSVEQSRGCQRPAAKSADQRRVRDRKWRITITGPPDERSTIRQNLQRYRTHTVPLANQGGKPMRPSKWLEASLADSGAIEVGRFRWRSGHVSVINHQTARIRQFDNPIVSTTREPAFTNPTAKRCRAWLQYLKPTPRGGFAYLIIDDSLTVTMQTTASPVELATVDMRGERKVVFADLDGHPDATLDDFDIRTSDNNQLSCEQQLP